MKLSTKKSLTTITYGALLITIAFSASTFALTESAHAESLLDRVKAIISSKKVTPQPVKSDASTTTVQRIISRGDAEINRRLQTLAKLNSLINSSSHLTASDKSSLQSEVNTTISGLTALKTKLDAETTTAGARADAQSIFTEYRVYALVVPKVHLIKLADDIQATDTKLQTLAGKLQTRINTAQSAGKDVTALEKQLTDLNAQIAAAQNIAGNVEAKVVTLEPSDYNTDHQVLSGYSTQLKNARSDDKTAYNDAASIAAELKKL